MSFVVVAPPGFEPGSRDPKSRMLGRYTTGLPDRKAGFGLINLRLKVFIVLSSIN